MIESINPSSSSFSHSYNEAAGKIEHTDDEVEKAEWHSRHSNLFIVAGSSLVVYPEADIPSGSKLVIINKVTTPPDDVCHLWFHGSVGDVLVPAVIRLQEIMGS